MSPSTYRVNSVPIVISDSDCDSDSCATTIQPLKLKPSPFFAHLNQNPGTPCTSGVHFPSVVRNPSPCPFRRFPGRVVRRRRKRQPSIDDDVVPATPRAKRSLRDMLVSETDDEVVPETPPRLIKQRRVADSPSMLMPETPPGFYKNLAASLRKQRSDTHAAALAHFRGETTRQEFAMFFGIVVPADVDTDDEDNDSAVAYDGDTDGGDQESHSEEEPNSDDAEFIDDDAVLGQGDEAASYAPSESGDSRTSDDSDSSV